MFRAIPVSNKLCFDKDIKRSWKIHEGKLSTLKSSVGKTPPQKFQFLDKRAKKIALQQMRNIQVDRQNNHLLKKIKNIQNKGCKTSYTRMYHDLSEHKKKTLNKPYRKRQLLKIIEENQEILKRLQMKKSEYNIKKMVKQRKEIQKNISLISSFPYKNYPQSHTTVNLWATTETFYNPASSKVNQASQELNFTFKGQRQIEGNIFVVTTYLSKGSFFLQIEGVQNKQQKYRIQLPEKKARDLLNISYGQDIQNMIKNLSIQRDKQICFLKYSPTHTY